jgi:predicted nucleic acid-binding Zn ribbon protein
MFKGSGFYVTDNRSHSSTALPGKKESETDKSEGETKSTDVKSPSKEKTTSVSD